MDAARLTQQGGCWQSSWGQSSLVGFDPHVLASAAALERRVLCALCARREAARNCVSSRHGDHRAAPLGSPLAGMVAFLGVYEL